MITATAKRPSEHTASAGRCPSSPQPADPSPTARPWPRTKASSSAFAPLCGEEGLRRHRGDADYSADKAATLSTPQLSNRNGPSATSERGPCFPERRLSSFRSPLNGCLRLDPTFPSTHAGPLSRLRVRSPPFPSLPLQTLPPRTLSDPLGPNPTGVTLEPHTTPPLSAAAADTQDRAPSFLHPSSLVPPQPPAQHTHTHTQPKKKKKKKLKHLSFSAKAHPCKRPLLHISLCPPLDSILLLSKGAGNERGRVPACKVWGTDLLSGLPSPSPRALRLFPGTRARQTRSAQQSPLAALKRQLQTVALRSREAACKPGPGQGRGPKLRPGVPAQAAGAVLPTRARPPGRLEL